MAQGCRNVQYVVRPVSIHLAWIGMGTREWDGRGNGSHWRGHRMHCHSKGSLFYTERGVRNDWNGCFLGITSCSMTKGSSVVTKTDYEPFSNLNEVWERGPMHHYGGLKAGHEYESSVLFWVQFLKELILYID